MDTNGKRKRDDLEVEYIRLPAFKASVTRYENLLALSRDPTLTACPSGFKKSLRCDFEVHCDGRTFHTHKLVLESIPYFSQIINGDWAVSFSS